MGISKNRKLMGLSIGCCIGTACCNALCCLCSKCGTPRRVFARLGYIILSLVLVLFSLLMLFYGDYVFSVFNRFIRCPDGVTKDACLQISAVYRMSFTLAIFHFLLFLICLCKGPLPTAIHEGAWPIKILFVVGLYFGSFFIRNSVFEIYGYIAMVLSGLFLIYEMILLIDIAYTWNSHWVGGYDSGRSSKCWMVLLIIFTVVFYGLGLTVCILMYIYYSSKWWSILLTTLTIFSDVVFSALSVLKFAENASLFTCSLIFCFVSCMNASVILSDPYMDNSKNALLQIFIGLAFLYLVLFYVSGTTVEKKKAVDGVSDKNEEGIPIVSKAGEVVMEKDEGEEVAITHKSGRDSDEEEKLPEITLQTALFHLLMTFVAFYFSMVLTNWGAPNIGSSEKHYRGFSKRWLGFGMKLTAQWVATLIFVWCLIAPKVCPNRDFN
eukprot:TRINITY_DN4769_c0_g1_i1.p1 TRINITY_DN4769_c0_g1~~TRINITY_DN4769_c0_g1_i1.p1  ORF type:complete len:438 (+),score=96.10 TRINITY_DN4769_c0_g1_i1:107-1420(+)